MPNVKSLLLVIAQFMLLGLLFVAPGKNDISKVAAISALMLFSAAVAIGIWALITMRHHTFSVLPEPVAGGKLCQHGPYSWVRHPMYLAVLLLALSLCIKSSVLWTWCVWVCLAVVLVVKLRREERLLQAQYPDYKTYMHQRSALVPRLF